MMMTKWLLTGLVIGSIIGFSVAKLISRPLTDTKAAIIWPWADSLDAVRAAPKNHQVIFENKKIRILEVILRPYEFEQMHTHRLPGVMFGYNTDTSRFAIIYYRNGYDSIHHRYFVKDSIKEESKPSDPDEPNVGHYMKPEGPHQIKNLSNVKIDVFRVKSYDADHRSRDADHQVWPVL